MCLSKWYYPAFAGTAFHWPLCCCDGLTPAAVQPLAATPSHCSQPKPKTQAYTGYSEEINSTPAKTAWLPTHLIHSGLVTILQSQLLCLALMRSFISDKLVV